MEDFVFLFKGSTNGVFHIYLIFMRVISGVNMVSQWQLEKKKQNENWLVFLNMMCVFQPKDGIWGCLCLGLQVGDENWGTILETYMAGDLENLNHPF